MASLNKILIIGRVGRVDLKEFGGGKLANVSVATSERYKDKSGEWQEETTWHNVVAYGSLASVMERFVQKGSNLYVEGRIRKRKYNDRDGNEKESVEVVAQSVELLDPKQSTNNNHRQTPAEDLGF